VRRYSKELAIEARILNVVAGFFLSVFFSKAKLAAIVAPFVHFGAIMPRYIFFRASDGQAISGKSIAALLPQTAFTFGASFLFNCT